MVDIMARRDDILQIAREHGGHDIRLFGSLVRGEQTMDSDVDFLIEMDENRSLLDLIAIKHALEDELGQKVDLVTKPALHRLIRDQILQEAVAL